MTKEIKVIIFDLGGVCLSDYWAKDQRLSFSQKFNIDYKRLHEYHIKNIKKILTGKLSEEEYFKGLFDDQNMIPKVKEAILSAQSNNMAFQEVLDLAKSLRKNYKIIAFTNEIREAAEFRIKTFNLIDYFEKVFVSSIIGYEKYDKEAFEYLIKELKVNPSSIIFIDNNIEYIDRAKSAGIKTILFKTLDQLKEDLSKMGVN